MAKSQIFYKYCNFPAKNPRNFLLANQHRKMNIPTLFTNPIDEIDAFYSQALSQNKTSDYNIDMSEQFNSIFFKNEILSQVLFYLG